MRAARLPIFYPLVMAIALTLRFFRTRRLPPAPTGPSDKTLTAFAALLALLMLAVLWGIYSGKFWWVMS